MEFLFENPLFIFILIGIISSLFKKGKEEEQKRPANRPQPKPKPFVESKPIQEPEIFRVPNEAPDRRVERSEKKKIEQTYIDKKKEAEAKIAALKEQQLELAKRTEQIKAKSSMNAGGNIGKDQNAVIEEKNFADAIIWSEILGPPRAKNPHRSMSRNP